MADILSQEEVDALLTAVSEGGVAGEAEPTERYHAARYDFKRPERISKDQFRGFQTLAEVFSRDLATSLGGSLRAIARVSVVSVDQITYDEYVLSVSNPTSYNVIQLPPFEGNLILEFSPSLTFPIIDRLLGGRGVSIDKTRELTEIEQRLVIKIIEIVLTTLVRSWRHLGNFTWKLIAQENDPQIVQIVTGSEVVLTIKFELSVGDITGTMSLCMPVVAIESMLEKVGAEYTFYGSRPQRKDQVVPALLREIILRTKTAVKADMVGSLMTVRDLLRMQVGDIVRLDNSASEEACVTVSVSGVPKFKAKQGRVGNKQGIQIVGRIQ